MKRFLSKHLYVIFLIILIIVQLAHISYVFGNNREGTHSDEGWAYGLANGYYQTSIFQDENSNTINFNKWSDSQILRNYIEVEEGTQFKYDSVFYNATLDNTPPFHSMLLHSICSFFPDTFSWWYSYLINAVSFIITIFSLYLLCKELTNGSDKIALISCMFYAFSNAAINTTIFLRMYALITALCVLLALMHIRLIKREDSSRKKYLLYIYLITLIGGFTHYLFLVLAAFFTITFGIYHIIKKKWKKTLIYLNTMFLAACSVFIIWPFSLIKSLTIHDIFGKEMPLSWEIRYSILLVTRECLGFSFPFPSIVFWTMMKYIIIFISIIIIGLAFLFRNESWFKSFIKKTKLKSKKLFLSFKCFLKNNDHLLFLLFTTCLLTLIVVAKVTNIFTMAQYSDRYLFFLMPIISCIFTILLFKCSNKFAKKKKIIGTILTIITLCICLISNHTIFSRYNYQFTRNCNGPKIESLTENADVILVTSQTWKLSSYCSLIRNSNHFFAVTVDNCMNAIPKANKLNNSSSPVYIILECGHFRSQSTLQKAKNNTSNKKSIEEITTIPYTINDVVNKYASSKWSTMNKFIQTEENFLGKLSIYRLR